MINLISGTICYILIAIFGHLAIKDAAIKMRREEEINEASFRIFMIFYIVYSILYLPYNIIISIYEKMVIGAEDND